MSSSVLSITLFRAFFALTIATLMLSCNKDQQTVNQIEGDWRVTSESFNDMPEDPATYDGKVYTFKRCGVSRQDCDGEYEYAGARVLFKYSVYDDGKRIKISSSHQGVPPVEEGDITEMTGDKMVFRLTDADGDVTERVMNRAD